MNQSDYLKSIMKMVGKVSPQNRGYLRASGLDRAYGASQAQRAGMLSQLGMRKKGMEHDVSLGKERLAHDISIGEQRLAEGGRQFNLGYGQSYDAMDTNEDAMKRANILQSLGLGVGVLQGVNQGRQIDKVTEELKKQRQIYDALIKGYGGAQ